MMKLVSLKKYFTELLAKLDELISAQGDIELTADSINLNTDQLEEKLDTLKAKDFSTSAKQDSIISAIEAIPATDVSALSTSEKQDEIKAAITTKYTTIMVEDSSDSNLIYIGDVAIGSVADTSSAIWRISRLDTTTLLITTWAEGSQNFNQIWNNRESLNFS